MRCYEDYPVNVDYKGVTYRGVANNDDRDYMTVVVRAGPLERRVRFTAANDALSEVMAEMVTELEQLGKLEEVVAPPLKTPYIYPRSK